MSEERKTDNLFEWPFQSGSITDQFWRLAKLLGFVFGAFLFVIGIWVAYEFVLVLWGDTGKGEAFRNVGLIFLAVIGAPFVVWRSWVAQKQANTAAQQAQLAEDRSFSDLFTEAVEQLGADKVVKSHAKTRDGELAYDDNGVPIMQEVTAPNIEVRLGAIYALQRISRVSEKDHIPIMKTLCAYIRENATEGEPEDFPGDALPDENDVSLDDYLSLINNRAKELREFWSPAKTLRSDVRAVLTVIADRSVERRAHEDNESYRLDLRRVNLQRADLYQVDFENADLRQARLEGAILFEANLTGVDFRIANLAGADLAEAELREAYLNFADLEVATFYMTNLQGADLGHAELQSANLIHADLTGASLFYGKLDRANLDVARLEKADLSYATLRGASLMSARLDGANLGSTNLENANLAIASLDGVNGTCTNFSGVEGLTEDQVNRFFGCAGTSLPSGLSKPKSWSEVELSYLEREPAYHTWRADRHAKNLPPFEKAPEA